MPFERKRRKKGNLKRSFYYWSFFYLLHLKKAMFKLQKILVFFFLRFLLFLLLLVLFYFFVVAFSVALKRVATISLLLAATTVLFCYHLFLVLFYFLYGCLHYKFALCFFKGSSWCCDVRTEIFYCRANRTIELSRFIHNVFFYLVLKFQYIFSCFKRFNIFDDIYLTFFTFCSKYSCN